MYTYQDVFNAIKYISKRFKKPYNSYFSCGITTNFTNSKRKLSYDSVNIDNINIPYNERLILKYMLKTYTSEELVKLTKETFNAKTKLGCHSIKSFNRHDIKFPVVKFILDGNNEIVEQVRTYKKNNPSCIIIGRYFTDNLFNYSNYSDVDKAAKDFYIINYNFINSTYDFVDFYEGQNEPDVSTINKVKKYTAFEIARMSLFLSHSIKSCHGNFSVGTPDLQESNPDTYPYIDAIKFGYENGCIYGRHEYGTPTMQTGYNWTTGRFEREFKLWNIKPLTVITECGIDPIKNVDTSKYMEQLDWYNEVLLKYENVIGGTIFTIGSYDNNWAAYDLEKIGIIEQLKQYNNSKF